MATGYHDFTAGETLTAANLEDFCMKQSVMIFASAAARNSALAAVLQEGMCAYLLDLNVLTIYSGAAWSTVGPVHGALTTWTPTVTQSGSVTVTTTFASYQRIGRSVFGRFRLTVTGSGTGNNAVTISLPVTAHATAHMMGSGILFDTSASSTSMAQLYHFSTTTMAYTSTSGFFLGQIGSAFSAGLASGDTLDGAFHYEVAADA